MLGHVHRESALTPSRGSVTLEEVADVARVSRATASRVVNGDRRVGTEARTAVEDAVRRLGYRPNLAARRLVTRRSDSVAVVIPEPSAQVFGDPFFPRLLRGISDALAAEAMQLVLLMPQGPADEERAERYLTAGHGDGVLLVSLHDRDPLPAALRRHRVPMVIAGRPQEPGTTFVDVDNRAGARSAVRHLAEFGRRRIATIAGPQDMAPGFDRLAGWTDAVASARLDPDRRRIEVADFSMDGGRIAMERLLERDPSIDAVFVASDLMAVGALAALREAGRDVPADVAVVGFDDAPIASTTDPQLTSVRQPIEEMGREMVRLVLSEIRDPGGPARRVILETRLVVRASTSAAHGRTK